MSQGPPQGNTRFATADMNAYAQQQQAQQPQQPRMNQAGMMNLPPTGQTMVPGMGRPYFGNGARATSGTAGRGSIGAQIPAARPPINGPQQSFPSSSPVPQQTNYNIMAQGGPIMKPYGGPINPESGPRFDMSDFPALGDSGGIGPQGLQGAQDFAIQNDDFPALSSTMSKQAPTPPLTAASGVGHSLSMNSGLHSLSDGSGSEMDPSLVHQGQFVRSLGSRMGVPGPSPSPSASNGMDAAFGHVQRAPSNVQSMLNSYHQYQPSGSQSIVPQSALGQSAQTSSSSGPSQFLKGPMTPRPDHYGLMGLLHIIRMTDPDLNTLALGTDLTTLGLNLNSSEVLYATFGYPCLDTPTRRDPDYVLPYCYYMQPPALKTSHLSKFQLETLFYIFYSMPKDTLQIYAAKELYAREWRYEKQHRLWFTRPTDATLKSQGYAPGSYVYFDINTWEKRVYRQHDMMVPMQFATIEEIMKNPQ